jgi:hypothetical protein
MKLYLNNIIICNIICIVWKILLTLFPIPSLLRKTSAVLKPANVKAITGGGALRM